MSDATGHPVDLLQDAVDDRLDAGGRAALDAHLAGCEACRRELAALRWTRAQVVAGETDEALPPDLTRRLTAVLDEADAASGARVPGAPAAPSSGSAGRWWWVGLAAAAIVFLVVWLRPESQVPSPSLPALVAGDLQAFDTGTLTPAVATTVPAELEATLQSASLGFPVRVFDFGMMNIALTGGGRHRVGDQPSALMAYRGADGSAVICQMYLGSTDDLPDTVDRRRHNDMDFFVYREGSATLVFWQEGDVVCVLAATGDAEAAVQLAYAKAVKV